MTRIDVPQVALSEPDPYQTGPSAVPSLEATPPAQSVEAVDESVRQPDPHSSRPSGIDRPWARSGFWLLQLVVLALYLVRLAATVTFHPSGTSVVLELSTLVLFMIPAVYSALNFGLAGAVLTTGWITVLAVPRFLASVHAHQYVDAWAELIQVVLLDGLAVLIGQRVSAEREARRLAETSREAHLRAEAMYRDLFDSNQAPILIVDPDGFVVETNASARRAFGRAASPSAPTSVRLVDMIGADAAARAHSAHRLAPPES